MIFPKFSKRVPFFSLITALCLLFIIAGTALYKYPLPILLHNIKTAFLRSNFFEKSSVNVSLDGNFLNLKFHILDKDQENVNKFLKEASLPQDILSGLSLELDSSSSERFAPLLPTEASILISPKVITFFSSEQSHLHSSDTGKTLTYATSGGSLQYQKYSSNEFNLQIEKPDVLLREASNSGKIHLSKNVSGLMRFLQKLSIINLTVNGKSVSGEIILK